MKTRKPKTRDAFQVNLFTGKHACQNAIDRLTKKIETPVKKSSETLSINEILANLHKTK